MGPIPCSQSRHQQQKQREDDRPGAPDKDDPVLMDVQDSRFTWLLTTKSRFVHSLLHTIFLLIAVTKRRLLVGRRLKPRPKG